MAWLNGGETAANWARHWSGGMQIYASWWNKYGNNSEGAQTNYIRTIPTAVGKYNAAVSKFNEEKTAYDAEVLRATAVAFPSVAFDVLARKINELLAKLK
jgi:hypothetical protein